MLESELRLIRVCCEFLELIYDPFFKWRNFLLSNRLTGSGAGVYSVDAQQLHPEIVPFIYTCFEEEEEKTESKRNLLNEIGPNLLNVLGAITTGSTRNGRLVICPATINVVMRILASWTIQERLRGRATKIANVMLIMLLKTSPVERQIDVAVVVQEYLKAMGKLVQSREAEIRENDGCLDMEENSRDNKALLSIIQNLTTLLVEPSTKVNLCHALLEGNVIQQLVTIPEAIKRESSAVDECLATIVEVIAVLCATGNYALPEKTLKRLFNGMRVVTGRGSGEDRNRLVQQCLNLATSPNDPLVVNSMVVTELIHWLPVLSDYDQEVVIAALMGVCTQNSNR